MHKKIVHKGTWVNNFYMQMCYGKVGTYPEIDDNWKNVTCKRCLKKKKKIGD